VLRISRRLIKEEIRVRRRKKKIVNKKGGERKEKKIEERGRSETRGRGVKSYFC